MTISIDAFKRIILLFWALWWLLAFLTDALGALVAVGALAASWLPHTNYPFLVDTLAPYHVPEWLPPLLFAGIIAWSFASTILFVIAATTPRQPAVRWYRRVNSAFIVSLSL